MKKISVVVPTFNERENAENMAAAIENEIFNLPTKYDYEIIFIDNYSDDGTREILSQLCENNKKIKAILNASNFGQNRSPYYGLLQTTGDCAILMAADFQDPPEMISKFICEWENGHNIIIGVKSNSRENAIMRSVRTLYYKISKKISQVDLIEHFTGFGLYDKNFIGILRKIEDPMPYLRGIVAEFGSKIKRIDFVQPERKAGKTKNNWYTLYDIGMLGITSYSKVILRLATVLGFIFSAASFIIALVYLILKLIFWDTFPAGTAPILIGLFLFGSILMFFIGFLGEYILNINTRVMKRPLVVEEKRINFKKDEHP